MVDVGKREDRLLDYVNVISGRIKFALVQIDMFRESGGLTANEIHMLNTIQGHLEEDEKGVPDE